MFSSRFQIRQILTNLDRRIQSIIIGIVVGMVSGAAALLLNFTLGKVGRLVARVEWSWTILLLPAAGIVLTVVWLKSIIKDFGGHGVPEVIFAVGSRGGRLKLRSSVSKLIGSLLTLAGGGSAGPEAPVVISGAAIGSNIAGILRTNERIRTAVTGSGAAAAIAAIFNAPVAGIIFTMEVILGDWTALSLLPVAIASATGAIVSRIFNGNQIPFAHREFDIGLLQIIAVVGLAVFTALASSALIRSLKLSGGFFQKITGHALFRALIGGLLVGGMVLLVGEVRGEGYELVRELIEGKFVRPAGIVFLLIAAKIAATSLTLSAGGAGGVFAPSLVIGSLSGLFYFQVITRLFPGAGFSQPGLYALVGMAGMLSGTLQAPLTAIFLIFEITSGYGAILPLMVVSFLSAHLVKLAEKHSIYTQELIEKDMLVRPRTDARILSDLSVEELLETDCISVHPEMTLEKFVPVIKKSKRNYFPVEDRETGKFLGMVTFEDVKSFLFTPELLPTIIIEEVMRAGIDTVSEKDSLADILIKFDRSLSWSLPVVEGERFKGLISKATLLDHYRKELMAQTEI